MIAWRSAADVDVEAAASPSWTCERLQLAPGRPMVLVAPSGVGKSLVATSIALSCASGQQVFGAFEASCETTALLDYELGARSTQRRLWRQAMGQGVDLLTVGSALRWASFPAANLAHGRADLLESLEGSTLVVIDSLRGATPGLDENAAAMSEPLAALAAWSDAASASVVIVHHAGHDGARARGSSAILDAAGAVWALAAEDGGLVLRNSKPHPEATGRANPIRLLVEDVGDGVRVVARAELAPSPAPAAPLGPSNELERRILATAQKEPGLSRDALSRRVGGRQVVAAAAIDRLVAASLLTTGAMRGRGATLYVANHSQVGANEAAE